jgi:hypothetical protein
MNGPVLTYSLRLTILWHPILHLRGRLVVDALHDAKHIENKEFIPLGLDLHWNELKVMRRQFGENGGDLGSDDRDRRTRGGEVQRLAWVIEGNMKALLELSGCTLPEHPGPDLLASLVEWNPQLPPARYVNIIKQLKVPLRHHEPRNVIPLG